MAASASSVSSVTCGERRCAATQRLARRTQGAKAGEPRDVCLKAAARTGAATQFLATSSALAVAAFSLASAPESAPDSRISPESNSSFAAAAASATAERVTARCSSYVIDPRSAKPSSKMSIPSAEATMASGGSPGPKPPVPEASRSFSQMRTCRAERTASTASASVGHLPEPSSEMTNRKGSAPTGGATPAPNGLGGGSAV
mmetsp:Transcript_17455/g.44684  ORF Transcript_17455/g.44684 Transcript_17455/m.44684 type:complete len:202 (-) Transcript_17455:954-1559(-)